MEFIIIFFLWLILGAATAYLANQRGRDPFLWSMGILFLSFFGLFFALIGMGLLYFLPTIDEDENVPEKQEFSMVELIPTKHLSFDEIAAKEWFYYDSLQARHGPCPFEKIKAAWKSNELKNDSYIWSEGMENWLRVAEMPELVEALQAPSQKTFNTLEK